MIAIIPALTGTPELPNIVQNLAGKPLIAYTIEAALNSKYIERVVVKTDSKEIELTCKNYGSELNFSHVDDDLTDTIKQLYHEDGNRLKDIIILRPSSPLRTAKDIDAAYEFFLDKNADSLVSLCETIYSPVITKKIVNDKIADFIQKPREVKEQTLDKAYLNNSAIFIFNYNFFINNGLNYTENTLPFVMPVNHSIEVNTAMDFEYAEFLIVKHNRDITSLKEKDLYKVLNSLSIRESIKKLDNTEIGFICVVNESNKVIGIVTDGDFRRAVLSGISLDESIINIAKKDFTFLNEDYTKEEVENIFFNNDIAHVPVLSNNELKEIILRKNIPFIKDHKKEEKILNVPVVIMAGGMGTRLKPFTHIMPKPLIPIGNKPLIEIIIDRFRDSGISEFYLSLNYKANMIKAYFEGRPVAKNLNYIIEDIPLGTAGALKNLKGILNSTFVVSNCDIIIKSDYRKIIEFHTQGHYDLTIVACMHHFTIPYGICSIEQDGCLKEISEKPEFDYLVNTGMYVLESDVIDFIPDNTFYHITQLIDELKRNNRKIGVYPVYEKSWIDVGQWEEYRKAVRYLE